MINDRKRLDTLKYFGVNDGEAIPKRGIFRSRFKDSSLRLSKEGKEKVTVHRKTKSL
jgi:hypothetical protein